MAGTRTRRVRATIRADVGRIMPTPELHGAIRRAQERNRVMLLGRVKARFAARHPGSPRKPAGYTVQGFQSNVRQDLNLSIFNRRPNAARVEYGVWPYIGLRPKGSRSLGPGRGRPIHGNPNLKFWWYRQGFMFNGPVVYHPGQKPDPIMADTLRESRDEIYRNIHQELVTELLRG